MTTPFMVNRMAWPGSKEAVNSRAHLVISTVNMAVSNIEEINS
jgi:hypothetical protein